MISTTSDTTDVLFECPNTLDSCAPHTEDSPSESVVRSIDLKDKSLDPATALHQGFTDEALEMARLALRTNETPVGCVLVHNGKIVAKGMNATNITRNGTRHAEFMAVSALLAIPNKSKRTDRANPEVDEAQPHEGHLYPYGQRVLSGGKVDRSIIRDCVLYVTVEPCVMCASFLRQLGIKKVYFGAVNDKFGGTGGVFSIHLNSDVQNASQTLLPLTNSINTSKLENTKDLAVPVGIPETCKGDGGNVEPGFEAEGGWGRDEAVGLLRRFYVQENGRAPMPRKKEGRAARLAAMEKEGTTNSPFQTPSPDLPATV